MQRPPRDPREGLFSFAMIGNGLVQGGLAFGLLMALFLGAEHYGLGPDRLRTLIFFALVSSILALVFANRSFSASP